MLERQPGVMHRKATSSSDHGAVESLATACKTEYGCGRTPDRARLQLWERRGNMPTMLAFHEVDDVGHWLSSPKREEVFGPLGVTAQTFYDPEGSNRVGLIVEIPDMAAFQEMMQSEAGAEAMKFDGVRPETMLFLTKG
jgi:hypothetical protein